MRTKEFAAFIAARDVVRIRKEVAQAPPPWTTDPILQTYRFCNVRREDDKVTQWIAKHWRKKWENHKQLWFAMMVARLFNLPDTLTAIGAYVLPFKLDGMNRELTRRKEAGVKNFNAAYIVSTNGRQMDKVDYITDHILKAAWNTRDLISVQSILLADLHGRLMALDGLGSFMAAQIVADVKYAPPWLKASDWHTFAASGPGSRRGLNRVMGRPIDTPWKEAEWHETLLELRKESNNMNLSLNIVLHAQDIQNCLCEFDKYERVRLGEGRPKQRYQGGLK